MTNRGTTHGAVAIALAAVISAGCGSNETSGKTAPARDTAVRFAECMRENGVSEFPDPDASGELTIDGVVNGSSVDPSAPAFSRAMGACKELQPPDFTGDDDLSDEELDARLEFAQCMRDNGVKDFPDPAEGEPPVDTRRIPSAAQDGGMAILNAAMQQCRGVLAEAAGGRQ